VTARTIGFWTTVALVMGNMIGSGVFLLPASLAPYGGVSLLGWLISTVGAMMLALVFARLARIVPATGGPYAYTRNAFGDFAGFLVAWGYWISMWCTNAALAVAGVGYLDPFFPSLVRNPVTAALMALAAIWLLTGVNLRGVRDAGRVQTVSTLLKILPLVAVGIGGLFVFNASHFELADTGGRAVLSGATATATLTLWAFLGLESATVPAGSIRDPNRTIPRATLTGTVLAAGIYVLSTVGVMAVLPPDALAASTAPFSDAARVLAGDRAAALVALGAAVSCFGALNGWILLVGQLPLAIAGDGLFPPVFARMSSRGVPARGILIGGVLSTILIAMNYSRGLVELFTFIILLATLSTLIPYVFSSLAVFLIPDRPGGIRSGASVGGSVAAALAFGYALWAIGGAGADVVYWGFLLLIAGVPVYVWVVGARGPGGRGGSPGPGVL
jgi:APA family basic amino acid/polyamine antiporter